MNKVTKYGYDLRDKACHMRNVLKEANGFCKNTKKRDNSFKQYDEQDKLYQKSKFMIELGQAIKKTTL